MTVGAAPGPARSRALARFLRNRGAVVGAIIVVIVVGAAVLAPLLVSRGPEVLDFEHGLGALGEPVAPHDGEWLGTDVLGRSQWSRIVHGAGISLEVAALATLIALSLGLSVGLIAGYAGGLIDAALMRLVDMVLAFPFLLLAILLAALLRQAELGSGTAPVYITLGVVGWTTMARVIRGKVLSLRELDFVHAARAMGAGPVRILTRHLLPNVVGVVVVVATLGFAQNVLAESVLSYLGLGPPPPTPTWGRMLYDGQPYYRSAPWLIVAPGVAILITVVGFNLLGEGLRDAFDPRDRR